MAGSHPDEEDPRDSTSEHDGAHPSRENNLPKRGEEFRYLVKEVTEYAIFMLDPEGHVATWNEGAERIKGYTEDEILGTHFSTFYPSEAVEAGLPAQVLDAAAREGQWTGEDWRVGKDGRRFWAHVTVRALTGDDGTVRGFAKVTRDMTERHRREVALERQKQRAEAEKRRADRENALLRLMEVVAAMAHDADDLKEALQQTVDVVCGHIDWPVGHAYWVREDDETPLVPTGIWCLDAPSRFDEFRTVTEAVNFAVGESLPGRVLQEKEPVWIRDVTADSGFVRSKRADNLGVKGAAGVPVAVADDAVAVLEFFSAEAEERDEHLLDALASVGVQLSRVAERARARADLRQSERRYRRLFEESRDAVVLTTPDGTIVDANSSAEALFGYSTEELLRMSAAELYADPEERARRIVPKLKEARTARILEAEMRHRDGHTFPATASVTVHLDEENHPTLVQALVRDVSDQRQLQAELLEVQDKERERMGRELHDGVCSTLTAAAILTSSVVQDVQNDVPIDLDDLDKATELIQQASEEARAISHGLSPVGLKDGLPSALEDLADQTTVRGEVSCSLEVSNALPGVPEETATHLYRIAQEAVTNAVKHAEADQVWVTMDASDDGLSLTIEDDGTGMAKSSSGAEGIGMRTMRHRADLINAAFTVEEGPEGGTLVRCQVPFPEGAEGDVGLSE